MRFLRIVIGFVLMLPLVLWGIGNFLGEDYEARVKLQLDAAPDAVFEQMLDYPNNPVTGRMFQTAEALEPENGMPVWRETISGSTVRVTTLESEAPSHLKMRFQDEELPMSAILDIRLRAAGGGTSISATNQTSVKGSGFYAPLFRLTLAVAGGLPRGLHDYFDKVAANLGVEAKYETAPD